MPVENAGHRTDALTLVLRLAQVLGHFEGVADRSPDELGVHPIRESALDRAPAELVEHEVLGQALRVDVAELRVHPVPEFRQPHVAQGTAAADQNRPGRSSPTSRDAPLRETFRPMCRY